MINSQNTRIVSMLLFLHLSRVKVPSSALHAQKSPILILRNQVSDAYKTVILNKLKATVIEYPFSKSSAQGSKTSK
jgi:hypothetical protein